MNAPQGGRPIQILMVEDNPDDIELTVEALKDARVGNFLSVVKDGEEAISYLRCQGKYQQAARPDLILLDLNMPRCNGHEALEGIKRDPALRSIPVIVLTTSTREEDIVLSYSRGVSSFISKPATFDRLIQVAAEVGRYWAETVTLPPNDH
jgi:CheY-like chemotaxis protein